MARHMDLPSSLRAFRGGWICIKTTKDAVGFITAVSKSKLRSPEWLRLRDAFRHAEESGDTNQLHRTYDDFRQQLIGHGWLRDPDALPLVTPTGIQGSSSQKRLSRVLFERFGPTVIGLERTALPMPGQVHDVP
jgi:hypothetical protein